eukprot:11066267-Ditylum_brightwellii.AAC.1
MAKAVMIKNESNVAVFVEHSKPVETVHKATDYTTGLEENVAKMEEDVDSMTHAVLDKKVSTKEASAMVEKEQEEAIKKAKKMLLQKFLASK